jgi:hypothetical protein
MTENHETKKRHPSPARRQAPIRSQDPATGGRDQDIAGASPAPVPDVLREQARTERGNPQYPEPAKRPA